MGGGAAMRAASKVAGFSVNGGIRRSTTSMPPLKEQSVTIANRKASNSVNAISSSSTIEDGRSAALLASHNDVKTCSPAFDDQRSWPVTDDWEFAGDEEELILDSMNPSPRVVFGGVPTLEEAKEATSDLKEALDKEYFSSSNAIGCRKSSTIFQESTPSVHMNSPYSENKAYSESVVVQSSVPNPVFQAFSLLKESPEVQGVVASIASDKNVWDAVMQNDKVMEFIKSQQTSTLCPDMDMDVKHSLAENEFHDDQKYSKNIGNGADGKESGNGFMELIYKVKVKVAEMVSNLSDFFQNIFGGPTAGNISTEANENANVTNVDRTIGASFMALAVLAVMVVVLKRGWF